MFIVFIFVFYIHWATFILIWIFGNSFFMHLHFNAENRNYLNSPWSGKSFVVFILEYFFIFYCTRMSEVHMIVVFLHLFLYSNVWSPYDCCISSSFIVLECLKSIWLLYFFFFSCTRMSEVHMIVVFLHLLLYSNVWSPYDCCISSSFLVLECLKSIMIVVFLHLFLYSNVWSPYDCFFFVGNCVVLIKCVCLYVSLKNRHRVIFLMKIWHQITTCCTKTYLCISGGYIFAGIYFRGDIFSQGFIFAGIYFPGDIFSRGFIFAGIYFRGI